MQNTVRTVADILNLPAWPSEQLRLVVERWQPAAEVRIERIRRCRSGSRAADALPSARTAFTVGGIFLGPAQSAGSRNSFQLCPIAIRADKNRASPLLPNLLPNRLGQAGIKTNEERQSAQKYPTDRDVK